MTFPNDTVSHEKLKSFIQRYVNLDQEIKDLNSDKSELLKEAANDGFDKKAIKAAARLVMLDDKKRDEDEQLDLLTGFYVSVYTGQQ